MKIQTFVKNNKCLVSVGILLTFIGTVLFFTSSLIFNLIIDKEFVLGPNKQIYNIWKKTPIPLTLEFYMFNWTNPEDVLNPDVKPRLEELGPYKFIETKEKTNIVWNNNGTVSFKQRRFWYFDEENSTGKLSDLVTTINPISLTAAGQYHRLSPVMRTGFSLSFSLLVHELHVTKTVGEFLFDGYSDMLLKMARTMPNLKNVELPPFDKFGWFYMRNGSTEFDGLMTMGTGAFDIPLGKADRWNYYKETNFYDGECARIKGSAGELWPPNVSKDKDIVIFTPDMCTAIALQFKEEVYVQGIKGYKFVGTKKTMDNGTLYPENKCFCTGECVPSGLINVTRCRFGAPGFVSFPHFYVADPFYVDQFEGLNPDPEKHEMSITLEPRTGIPLAVSAKFQINLLLTPHSGITLYADAPRLFFPMIWLQQEVTIPDTFASALRQLLNLPYIGTVTAIIILILGLSIVTSLATIFAVSKYRQMLLNKQLQKTNLRKEIVPLREKEPSVIVIKAPCNMQRSQSYLNT